MAQLVKKTPMELFGSENVAIKPNRFAMRTRWEPDYSKPTNGGWSGQKSKQPYRNGMPAQAQSIANVFNEPVGTHNPQYKERIPRSRVGPYGTIKLPEQWKYKTGTELATAMTKAAKVDPNDEDSIWDAFESGKITEEQRNKMLSERTGRIANKGSDENNGDGWKDEYEEDGYPNVDADYERSWGPVDTKEKFQAYQKWLKGKK